MQFKITIQGHNETIDNLRSTISLLETNIDSEKNHSTGKQIMLLISSVLILVILLFLELKNQIEQQMVVIKDNEHVKMNLKGQIEELLQERNSTTDELEEIKLNSVQMLGEKDIELRKLQKDYDKHSRELFATKTEISELQSMLKASQEELSYVNNEFTSYKVCISLFYCLFRPYYTVDNLLFVCLCCFYTF